MSPRSPKWETTYHPPRSTIPKKLQPDRANYVRNMCYQSFSFFGPSGLTPGQKFTKGEKTWRTPRSTILQNFIALRQPTPEMSVTKILRTKKQTSTPVARTGVYPHMPIAVTTVIKDTFGSVFSNTRYKILCMYSCRTFYDSSRHRLRHPPSPRNTNSLQHWP